MYCVYVHVCLVRRRETIFIFSISFSRSTPPSLTPPQGDLRPDDAANMLTIFEGKFTRLKEDRDNVIKAKEALELADPGVLWGTALILYRIPALLCCWKASLKLWQ